MPTSSRGSPPTRLRTKLLLAAGASLLALAGLEAVARWRAADYGPTTNPHYVLPDPRLGWRYRPRAQVRHRSADFDVTVRIGADGFRGQPRPSPRPAEIVLLGDSLAFGWGVEDGQTAAVLLGDRLGCEVANLGVSGYGTDQEYLLLEEQPWHVAPGAEPAPKQAIVLYCANDLEEVSRDWMYGKAKPYFSGTPPALELSGTPIEPSWLGRRSSAWRMVRKHWHKIASPVLTQEQIERAQHVVVELYARMQALLAQHGCELRVAHAGEHWLDERLRERAIPVLDLAPALGRAEHEAAVRFGSDPHWTAHGQAAVAEALAVWLRGP